MESNEIILYQPNEALKLNVRVEDETVWLTQSQIVELFDSSKGNITPDFIIGTPKSEA